MFGGSDRETIDKMKGALDGYRQRDANRGVPDKPDAYQQFDLPSVPDAIRPHIEQLASDPLFKAVADVAIADKVPVATMQKLTTTLYAAAQEAGILEAPIDVAAERAQLVPEAAKNLPQAEQDRAIDARMQANQDFMNLLSRPGAGGPASLTVKDAEHVGMMLMDSAAGNRFLELFRANMTGANVAQPQGGGGQGAAGGGREALKARLGAPEMQPGHPQFSKAAHDALMADYQKAYGE